MNPVLNRSLAIAASLLAAVALPVAAAQVDIAGPAGSVAFGTSVVVLPNGNIVVTDPDKGANQIGAVYLYGPTGTLISTLSGSSTGDHVGDGGIVVLGNGNYVITSQNWSNVGASGAGAVTWGSAVAGVSGTVSAANSLVGSTTEDRVGTVTALGNGNYVVVTDSWHNLAVADAGAVTWCNGSSGKSGAVSVLNSLVGTTTGDRVGRGQVFELVNHNLVVVSPDWNNGVVATAVGAATWINGASGIVGAVSATNSLVGTTSDDHVGADLFGDGLVKALS